MRPARFRLLCAVTGVLLTSCSAAPGDASDGPLVVRGSLDLRERIALPSEAIAVVELREGSEGRVVAESRQPLGDRQLPVPFEVADGRVTPAAPARTVRGAILVGGRPAWVSEAKPVSAGTATVDVGALMLARYQPLAFASTLKCGERSARFGIGKRDGRDVPQLDIGDRRFDLKQVVTASGARYEAIDDPRTGVRDKGNRATVVVEGEAWPECEVAPAGDGR